MLPSFDLFVNGRLGVKNERVPRQSSIAFMFPLTPVQIDVEPEKRPIDRYNMIISFFVAGPYNFGIPIQKRAVILFNKGRIPLFFIAPCVHT